MSDETQTEETQPKIPTMEDMKAIAEEAARAAVEARDESGSAGKNAAVKEAAERGIELPEEVLTKIGEASAAAVIMGLEERGAFHDPTANIPEAPNTEEKPNPEAKPEGAAEGDAPAKKTFAQRYLGM